MGGSEQGLSDVQVRCVLEDNARRLWIGTFLGLDCFDPLANKWTHYNHSGDSPNSLSHISVLSLHKDTQGNIWAGTYYGGANIFNPDENGSHFYHAEPLREGSLSYPIVGKMTEDGEGNLWICTEGGDLTALIELQVTSTDIRIVMMREIQLAVTTLSLFITEKRIICFI